MKIRTHTVLIALFLFSTLISQPSTIFAQGTSFTYQGQLQNNGGPASGTYNLTFTLFNTNITGVAIAGPVTNNAVAVSNGLFTVRIDFGPGVFSGQSNWLEIGVETNGFSSFTILAPRQQLTPTPYAIFANTASNLSGALPVAQLNGTVPLAQLPGAVLTNNETGVSLSNLTLNGALNLPSTVISPDTIYSGNALLLYADNYENFFSGQFAGNSTMVAVGNTGIGDGSLGNNTSGDNNTAIGFDALADNTIGNDNTANGVWALSANTNGGGNTASGYETLFLNTSGNYNTADGFSALFHNLDGSQNTANGGWALYSNTNGNNNTANGYVALYHNTSGTNNTADGYGALFNNTTGSYNTTLGCLAGLNITTGGSNIDIGNEGLSADTNIIRIGSGQTQTFIAGVINGDGGGLSNLNVSAAQLTSIGNTNGGSNNFFVGPTGNSTMSGSVNTAEGDFALFANTSGFGNTANGYDTLRLNTNGSENTAEGDFALFANTSGSNNIALGYQAGINITTGSSNIDIGNPGLATDTNIIRIGSGQSQAFIAGVITNTGPLALKAGTDVDMTANNNVNVTANLAMDLKSGTTMAIQSGAGLTLSATLLSFESPAIMNSGLTVGGLAILGGGLFASGGVGIGTNSPQQALSVVGGLNIDQAGQNIGNVNSNALTFGSASGEGIASKRTSGGTQYDLELYTGFNNRMIILNNGNVGIGTTSPGTLLQVGSATCNGTAWLNGSDRNSKEDFAAINPRAVLEKVSALPITEWKYKVEADGIQHLGPMAQDFHAAFGLNGPDDKHIATVDEEGVALAAIQGLNQKLNEKDAELQKLKEKADKVDSLEKRLNELEQLVQSLAANK